MKKVAKTKVQKQQHSKKSSFSSKKRKEETKLDRALEETFPASDPITLY